MKTEIAFWDTSAIIPLYCNQVMSAESRRIRRRFKLPVVWWGTHVEIHRGLGRLLRDGLITTKQSKKALEKWDNLRLSALVVLPETNVSDLAASLTAKHDLRALDSFQLAAALVWCKEKPRNRPFICADNRLAIAARDAGFDVVSLA